MQQVVTAVKFYQNRILYSSLVMDDCVQLAATFWTNAAVSDHFGDHFDKSTVLVTSRCYPNSVWHTLVEEGLTGSTNAAAALPISQDNIILKYVKHVHTIVCYSTVAHNA